MSAPDAPKQRRNWWIWVSAGMTVVAVGLLIWALTARSDTADAQKELASTQQQLADAQATPSPTPTAAPTTAPTPTPTPDDERGGRALLTAGTVAVVKRLYDDLADQLGATQEELASTQEDLADANDKAEKAEKDAADAKAQAEQSDDETEKAKAQAQEAQAELSKATVAADCAKAYVAAFGDLFSGDSIRDQAPKVRDQFASITSECRTALSGH